MRTRLLAEGLGTALLLATVVGSGIMGERLANGNAAVALLANALATGAMLFVLISLFAPLSGAHFNPAVTLVEWMNRSLGTKAALAYVGVQIAGAFLGVVIAHAMFDLPVLFASTHVRTGAAQWWSEFVATFGLVLTILLGNRFTPQRTTMLVACYISAAYWFTASTSFANPVVTMARAATDTFSGIRPADVLQFVLAQLAGAIAALLWVRFMLGSSARQR